MRKAPVAGIAVYKKVIYFHDCFSDTNDIKKYITFAENDEGNLCFKFKNKKGKNDYNVCLRNGKHYQVATPLHISNRIVSFGNFEVNQKEGWFVTDCKLK